MEPSGTQGSHLYSHRPGSPEAQDREGGGPEVRGMRDRTDHSTPATISGSGWWAWEIGKLGRAARRPRVVQNNGRFLMAIV